MIVLPQLCEISFICAQVERVLKYDPDDLVSDKMMDLLVPASREALRMLVNKLLQPDVTTEAEVTTSPNVNSSSSGDKKKQRETTHKSARDIDRNNSPTSAGSAGENTNNSSEAVVISEQSFPLSVAQVKNSVKINEDDGTDGSGNG